MDETQYKKDWEWMREELDNLFGFAEADICGHIGDAKYNELQEIIAMLGQLHCKMDYFGLSESWGYPTPSEITDEEL